MILEAKINLDWIDEDETIDSVVRKRIVDAVIDRLGSQIFDEIKKSAMESMKSKIDDGITIMLGDFLEQPVIQTDNWGDKVAEYDSVREMMKTKFDSFMTQHVNSSGKPVDSCSYGEKYTRIEWLIDSDIEKRTKQIKEHLQRELEQKIKEMTTKAAKDALANTILSQVGIEGALALASKP